MKEQISQAYTATVKHNFGDTALVPRNRSALVVGTDRPGSIGQAVASHFVGLDYSHIYAPFKDEFNVLHPSEMGRWFWSHELVDTMVLCHGVTHLNWFEDQDYAELAEVVQVNLLGTMNAVRAFLGRTMSHRHMRKHIVIVGSMAYRNVLNGSAPYCATKAGVAHLVRCLGYELTPKGYWTFGVHPGNVADTPMARDTIQGLVEYRHLTQSQAEEYWATGNLMPQWLRADDVAATITTLVDGLHGYQSGTNIELSGGQR